MTTSRLNPFPGPHNDQALRDFALEAPFEWQQELNELVDLRQEKIDADELAHRLDSVKDSARDLLDNLMVSIEDLRKATDGKTVAEIASALDDHEKEATELSMTLEKALDLDDALDEEPPQKSTKVIVDAKGQYDAPPPPPPAPPGLSLVPPPPPPRPL